MKRHPHLPLALLPLLLHPATSQHYLLLELTFDSNPSQTSWKFSNARSTKTLDYRSFGDYDEDKAGTTVKERLSILDENDLDGDALVEGVVREYSFVIYDEGGDGLCCANGEGSYALYNRGKLLFIGNTFGTSKEHSVRIDPADFLESESSTSDNAAVVIESNPTDGNDAQATWNTPTTPPPSAARTSIPAVPTTSPVPTVKPVSPTAQLAVDQERWYCGSSWDWVIRNCEEAIPCRGGDASVCPPNFACFASTPCTPEPTDAPSDSPSTMPSVEPTETPTKSPWSESAFVTFLYGDNTGSTDQGETSGGTQGSGGDASKEEQVNNALENSDALQFHFYCGYSWSHADETCNKFCPTGDRAECPDGMDCFANTQCDGRDTPPPTESFAPTSSAPVDTVNINIGSAGSGGVNSGGDDTPHSGLNYRLCSLCTENQLDVSKTITINDREVTCGSVENMFTYENLLMGSDNCNAVQRMYQETCCYDACQLCESATGEFLDLQDVLLQKGGYSATCSEVNSILSATPKDDQMCFDAKRQLAGDCCYKQCTLCDTDAGETTSWYATIDFQGIQSTCLGLDFMLRTEQVGSGSDRCSSTRDLYQEECCYVAPPSPCQLCEADGKVYGVNSSKNVATVERSSTMSCAWINDDLAKLPSDDQQCAESKGAYFGKCCDLTGVIGMAEDSSDKNGSNNTPTKDAGGNSTSNVDSNATPGTGNQNMQSASGGENATEEVKESPKESYWSSGGGSDWDPAEWNPPSGSHKLYHIFSKGTVLVHCLCLASLHLFL